MLAADGVRGLLQTLQRCVQQKNLNASCGVLRRIVSEVPPHDPQDDSASVNYVGHSPPLNIRRNTQSEVDVLRQPVIADVLNMAMDMVSSGNCDTLRPPSQDILAHVAQRRQDWIKALHFASTMRGPPSPEFVSTLVTRHNYKVVDHYRREKGWRWNVPMVIERLGSVGAWHAALRVALAAERADPHSDMYSLGVLVPLLARRSSGWSQALRLFQEGFTVGSLLDDDLVAGIFRGCAAAGRWQVAMTIASTMALTHQLSHQVLTSPSICLVAQQCPHWELSLSLCSRAVEAGASLNWRTVEVVLAECDRRGAWEAATALFGWATTTNVLRGHNFTTSDSYKAVVRSFHHTAQWEQAMEAISWMGHCSEAAATIGLVEMVALSEKAGQWDVALQVGAQLLQQQHQQQDDGGVGSDIHAAGSTALVSSNGSGRAIPPTTYLSLHYACAMGNQWATSLALYHRQLTDHRISPHPLAACSVLQACFTAKAWCQGLRLYAALHASKPRVVVPPLAHALTMKLCVEQNRWIDALQLLHWMQADGLPLDNHGQRLGMWASALCGAWLQSLRHYHAIPRNGRTALDSLVVRKSTEHSGPLARAMVMRQLNS